MKLFSQIDSLNNQNKRADNNNELFSFNQNYHSNQSFPNFQMRKSKSKYSFKLQPQLYFQKRYQQKQKLYQVNNHITLLNESKDASIKEQPKPQYSRKKIFNNDPRVTYLRQQLSLQDKAEGKDTKPVISIPYYKEVLKEQQQQIPKRAKLEQIIIPQQINQNNISPVYAHKTINSSYQQMNHKRKINKVSFDHEESNRFLMKPILEEPRNPQLSPQIHPNIQNIMKTFPKLIEKVQQNEKQVMDISKRLDNKAVEDNYKQQYLMKLLAEKDRQSRQKDIQLQYLRNKSAQKQKMNFQIQQATRLQLLILENKHLTLKVQKEQQRLSQQKEKEDLERINQRIEELKKMRQIQLQTNSSFPNNSFNLDTSLVPHHYIGGEITSKPLVKILRTQNQDESSHNVKRVTFKYPNIYQSHLIPQRDVPHIESVPKIKQIYVPITRIY